MTDWPIKTLGEICRIEMGRTPSRGDSKGWDKELKTSNHWASIADLTACRGRVLSSTKERISDFAAKTTKVVPTGTLVMSFKLSIGKLAFAGCDLYTNEAIAAFHLPKKSEVDSEFLYWALMVVDWASLTKGSEKVKGATMNKAKLNVLEIPVPPLAEQKRIVALLDAATARVTELTACYEQARTHANDLLESSLLELFAGAFESQPKRKMGEVLQIARGGSPRPISEYITKSPNGVNWIKIGDASSSTKYIYETAQKIKPEGVSRSRMVYPGDFLLSNSMSFGRPYIMKTEGCIHDGWLVLRDSKGELDQDFLFYMLGSRFMYKRFSQLAAGSTVQNLNSALVSSIEIPVPPIDFQKRIAEKARLLEENVARLNGVNEIRLQHANDLRQSILEAAFAGEL
jgi:restriction endonuclease S subunit